MKDNRIVTRKKLNSAVGILIRRLDKQIAHPLKSLEGQVFKIGKKGILSFRRKIVGDEFPEDKYLPPKKVFITYVVSAHQSPLLKAEVAVADLPPYASRLTILCSEPVLGYSILGTDKFGNNVLYKSFSNNPDDRYDCLRQQLACLSRSLSLRHP